MNKDILEGNWKEFKGILRSKWAKLTDNDIEAAQGQMEQIKGKIQKNYGLTKEQFEKEYDDFKKSLSEQDKSKYSKYIQ